MNITFKNTLLLVQLALVVLTANAHATETLSDYEDFISWGRTETGWAEKGQSCAEYCRPKGMSAVEWVDRYPVVSEHIQACQALYDRTNKMGVPLRLDWIDVASDGCKTGLSGMMLNPYRFQAGAERNPEGVNLRLYKFYQGCVCVDNIPLEEVNSSIPLPANSRCTRDINKWGNPSSCSCPEGYGYNAQFRRCDKVR